MTSSRSAEQGKAARLTLLSVRAQERKPGYGLFYEFEDVVSRMEGAPVVPMTYRYSDPRERVRRKGRVALARIGRPAEQEVVAPAPHSDVVLLTATTPYHLRALDELTGVPASTLRCAYLPELWPRQLERCPVDQWRPRRLDHVFVSVAAVVEPLRALLRCPVTYVPLATDVVRFARAAHPTQRPIDVLNIGRRDPAVHDELRATADRLGWRYHFDTMPVGDITDFPAHRDVYAGLLGITSVAICNNAKFDDPELTSGMRETSSRHFECLAAGTIMVGQPPDEELLERIGLDPTAMALLRAPAHDPAEVREVTARALATVTDADRQGAMDHAAAAHDWSHRWEAMTAALGLDPPRGLGARQAELAGLRAELCVHDDA